MYENDKYKVGQIIPIGRYMQKTVSEYQPVEWRILDVQDGKASLSYFYHIMTDQTYMEQSYDTNGNITSDHRREKFSDVSWSI